MISNFLDLNLRETFKGFILAFIGAIFMAIKTIMDAGGSLPVTWADWQTILMAGVGVGFTYIVTTFFCGPAAANSKKQKKP
jgi:hypothetical protein